MTDLEFLLAVIDSLGWPVATVVIIYLLLNNPNKKKDGKNTKF